MHELALAHAIGEIAIGTLREQPREVSLCVGKVWVRVGDLSGVDPEALSFCFEVVRGEWVETAGAALAIERRPARVRCSCCGAESEWSETDLWEAERCRACGGREREMTGGRELEVFRVELLGPDVPREGREEGS